VTSLIIFAQPAYVTACARECARGFEGRSVKGEDWALHRRHVSSSRGSLRALKGMASTETTEPGHSPAALINEATDTGSCSANQRANPDMVAVTLRCSSNIGNVQDQHLQNLLRSLHEVC
jgi:hypothetical protein